MSPCSSSNISNSSRFTQPGSPILDDSKTVSLSEASNLSEFLPFSNFDISCENVSDCDSFYTQASVSLSQHQTTTSPPPPPARHTFSTKKAQTASSLPNIMVTNHRSVFPKFHSLIDELVECEMHVGLHSEIWEDKEKVEHKDKIEEALELHGIMYISNPRPKRRGGGAAITLCDLKNQFSLSKLPIHVPPELEVCWGLVKPTSPGSIKEIVICSFYCPPKSKKKTKLVEHISVNYFKLKSTYPKCAFICGGDKNDLNIKHLLDISPSFRQIVTKPTHKQSILEVIVTDIGHFYKEPVIRPALLPDIPGHGVPSDHKIVFTSPNNTFSCSNRSSIRRNYRPFTTDAKRLLALWIQSESWNPVFACPDSDTMVAAFTELVQRKIEENCPLKTFKTNCLDNEFTTPAIQRVRRQKGREYVKHGNSPLFKVLKKKLKATIKDESKKFITKQVDMAGEKGNKWVRNVASLYARPGESIKKTFVLPDHVEP